MPDAQTDSFLDELRGDYEAAGRRKPLDLDIPWAEGRLVVRYGVAPREKTAAITNGLIDGSGVTADVEDDILIAACVEVLARRDGELVPLDDAKPVRFDDDRLGDLLGFEASSARDCLHKVFRSDEFPLAITGHFAELLEHMQTIQGQQRARAEGKSGPPSGGS